MLSTLEQAARQASGALDSGETGRLRMALGTGRIGSWEFQFDPPRLDCSAACRAHFGVAPDAPFGPAEFRAAIHPDDLIAVDAALAAAREWQGDYEVDYRCRWPDGSTHWINTRGRVVHEDGRATRMVGITLDVTERVQAEQALRISESRLAGQKAALELMVGGAPIDKVLERLVLTAKEQVGGDCRVAIVTVDRDGKRLRFGAAIGLGESYARAVDGLEVSPVNPCWGTGVSTGKCVVVPDVTKDPRWEPYLELAREYQIRSVWSFPIRAFDGDILGTFAVYHSASSEPRPHDFDSLEVLVQTAALILQQHRTVLERREARAELERSRSELQAELDDSKLLQGLSAALVHGDDEGALYQTIVSVAATIARSQFSSLQMLCRQGKDDEYLKLLASQGLGADGREYYARVAPEKTTVCGQAYHRVARVIVPDVEDCRFLAPENRVKSLQIGIRSLQTTPLLSRAGEVIGMISTHWREPHVPSERDLRLLDILARQAADLIERQTSADTLRASEERYRTLASVTSDVLWTADKDGEFTEPQPAWTEYTGQAFHEYCHSGWLQAVHPDDRERVLREWQESVANRKPHYSEARVWNARAGAYRHTVSRGTAVFRPDGSVREWVGSDTDVHEQKQMAESLQEAARRKDEFLATLAHELRNPLAPLRNGLQIIKLVPDDRTKVERAVAIMDRQLNQMVRLIDDLLDVSRFSLGKVALRREHLCLKDVVQQALETCSPLANESGQVLTLDIADDSVVVFADPTRLAQVFINLLNNAIKFTPRDGRIAVQVTSTEGQVCVTVQDEGLGIEPEELPNIFELFTQLDSSLERAHGGLGIGLSLARWLVQMHGGSIEARSEGAQKGSQFSVYLPKVTGAVERTPEAGAPARPADALRFVLVVDDNRDAATSLATLLRLQGHEAVTAASGVEALRLADARPPEVILLDLGMPHMSGYDVARCVRDRPWGQSVLLVALTGWGQEQDRRRSHEAGFDHHLVKPVDLAELERLLHARLPTDDARKLAS